MASVRLEGVRKRFGRTEALRGIDLEVRDGESIVLLGPSGCGKTTTLRVIAGLERPDEGRVLFDGRDVTRLPPRERNVAMVFQSYALWPHMRVYDNIAFPLRIRRLPEGEVRRRVRWAAELLEIEGLLDRYPHQLSGGQQQRVAVARAIVVEPEVLLMDEPLSNLDAQLRVKMRGEIRKLQRRLGVTLVYVTHDQVEAMVIGDRIAVMNEGRIVQVGEPVEVYERPSHVFVATFLGSPSMNILEGEVRGGMLRVAGAQLPVEIGVEGRILVGFRPERAWLGRGGDLELRGTVDLVEPLGSDTVVYVSLEGGGRVAVRRPGTLKLQVGAEAVVSVKRGDIHLYDPGTGEALAHGV